jgi:8-oxo-dGTP pyrophosphatase MutT (NUDIX family)
VAEQSWSPAVGLRRRVEERLLGTEPGGDPLAETLGSPDSKRFRALRKLLPARLSRAAVMVPLIDRPEGMTVLLTRRASHLKHHAGQISFPGGRIEPVDAGPWEAALRETTEEIGLGSEFVSLAGYLPDYLVISGYVVTPAVACVAPGFELRLDYTEVDAAFEVPLEFILDPANRLRRERRIGGVGFTSYEFPYQGHQIWGATAGMLMSLCRRIAEP